MKNTCVISDGFNKSYTGLFIAMENRDFLMHIYEGVMFTVDVHKCTVKMLFETSWEKILLTV